MCLHQLKGKTALSQMVQKRMKYSTPFLPQSSQTKPAPRPTVFGKERNKQEWGQQLLREAGCIQMQSQMGYTQRLPRDTADMLVRQLSVTYEKQLPEKACSGLEKRGKKHCLCPVNTTSATAVGHAQSLSLQLCESIESNQTDATQIYQHQIIFGRSEHLL